MDEFDIAVVGGGIAGLGLAREAALAGWRVVLLEKGQIGRATSASSLRIMHGGIRYLQTLDLRRVCESLADQNYWLKQTPQFIKPLPCLLPLERFGLRSAAPLACAALLYNALSCLVCWRANGARLVPRTFVEEKIAALRGAAPHGALLWYDALIEDLDGFTSHLARQAQANGAFLHEGSCVRRVRKAGKLFQLSYETAGRAGELSAQVVVNATGPWLNSIELDGLQFKRRHPCGWCKAFNLLLKRQLEPGFGFGIRGEEGRFYFFVPRDSGTVLGTCYLPFYGSPDGLSVSEREAIDFLNACNKALPSLALTIGDLAGIECGVLPMRKLGPAGPVLYGRERISEAQGYIEIMSTKYTVFRSQALKAMKIAQPYLKAAGRR